MFEGGPLSHRLYGKMFCTARRSSGVFLNTVAVKSCGCLSLPDQPDRVNPKGTDRSRLPGNGV